MIRIFALSLLSLLLTIVRSADAQEITKYVEAQSFVSVTSDKSLSATTKTAGLASKSSYVFLKFDLRDVKESLSQTFLRIPLIATSRGSIKIRKSNQAWPKKSLTWKTRPKLERRVIAQINIAKKQKEILIKLGSIISKPDIYTFGIIGIGDSKVFIRSLRGKVFPQIEIKSPVPTPDISLLATVIPARTITITPTISSTTANTRTRTPVASASATNSATPTRTKTVTSTFTPSALATSTRTATPTSTGTFTRTATPVMTYTATKTSTASPSASPTATRTATASSTATIIYTATRTATAVSTATRTNTPTSTATQSPTVTRTPVITATATSSPTMTPPTTATQIPVISGVTITRGPYLQLGTSDSVVLRWKTSINTDSVVYYGSSNLFPGSIISDSTQTKDHIVKISGLSANSTYYYRVGTTSGAFSAADSTQFFKTAPLTGTNKQTRIWVLGDSGTANASARAVRDGYQTFTGNTPTDLWLMLGDNAYNSGTDTEYQNAIFNMYPNTLKNSVLWPTYGNHDAVSANASSQSGPYFDIFSLPKNAEAGGIPSGTEAYYSFNYGQIHFVCLDSSESNRVSVADGSMLSWLENDLAHASASSDTKWIIAFWHHPPYSKGSHDSDTETELIEMRENALQILENYGTDLVLAGHSHAYERSYLIDGHYGKSTQFNETFKKYPGSGNQNSFGPYLKPIASSHSGTVYIVAGTSGKISAASGTHPAMYFTKVELGSLVIDIDGNKLDANFINSSGIVRDTFTIQKAP